MSKYPKSEYSNTQNMSMADKLIRAQSEQIRRITAEEYIKDKCIKANTGSRHWKGSIHGDVGTE